MSTDSHDEALFPQIRLMLVMAGAKPARWMVTVIAVSLVLAALDTLGVAAMVPLTQLLSGADTTEGVLGALSLLVGTTDPSVLVPVIAAIIGVLFVAKSLASIVFRWWMLGRTTRVSALSAAELLRRYVLAPYADHRTRRTSEIYRNINDSTNQSASVLMAIVGLTTDLLVLAAISVVLALTAPAITLLVVVLFGGTVLGVQRLLRRRQSRIGEEIAVAGLQAWQFMIPSLDGFREARLSSSGSAFVRGFEQARLRSARAGRQMGIIAEAPRYILEIGFVVAILAVSLILFATSSPAEALTVLGVFAAASLRAVPTLNRVAANLATLRTGRVGLGIFTRSAAELERAGAHDEKPRSTEPYGGDITLVDVRFSYSDAETLVIDGVTLRITQNKTTAFVGSSGAGKSTLVDLMLGLLEPTSGTIECGGRPILADRARWYSHLGVVPQDVFLINGTLRNNIAFGQDDSGIDETRVGDAVGKARLQDLVDQLPSGLDTIVGERGVRLSGGQRQRVGIARALYRHPDILVLDEATSALDNVTEHEIAATLDQLKGSMTIVVVAHRLSTIRDADTIVFLQEGRVAAMGRFDELRRGNKDFAHLVKLGQLS